MYKLYNNKNEINGVQNTDLPICRIIRVGSIFTLPDNSKEVRVHHNDNGDVIVFYRVKSVNRSKVVIIRTQDLKTDI